MLKEELLGTRYWDLFQLRKKETVEALKKGQLPPLRRLSLHITNKCNLHCAYCNEKHTARELPRWMFVKLVEEYAKMGGGVLHMTGGEPMCVPWLQDEIIRCYEQYSCIDFHVNTNATMGTLSREFLRCVKRMKISLDTHEPKYFDELVGVKGSFANVMCNLDTLNAMVKEGDEHAPTTSLTYTMTAENYKHIPGFMRMFHETFPELYAAFYSCYKGTDPRFSFKPEDVNYLFTNIVPQMEELWAKFGNTESKFLFHASHDRSTFDEKERFALNKEQPCYLQLSEMVIDEDGFGSNCSHLFRDGVGKTEFNLRTMSLMEVFKNLKMPYMDDMTPLSDKCIYGCNKKLVRFNSDVSKGLFVN